MILKLKTTLFHSFQFFLNFTFFPFFQKSIEKSIDFFLFLILCFCLLFFSACGSPPTNEDGFITSPPNSESRLEVVRHSTYYIVSERNELLEEAVKVWNEPLGYELFQFGRGDFEITVEEDHNFSAYRDRETPDGENHGGAYRRENSCRIALNITREADISLDSIMLAHELGHCIGFRHSTYDLSIMYPQIWIQEQGITTGIVELLN